MNLLQKISDYKIAVTKAIEWLESLQNDGGEISGCKDGAFYYRLLWTLTVMGRSTSSQKLLNWIKDNEWNNGNIGKKNPIGLTKQYSYILSNIVIGLYLNNEYKLAKEGLQTLQKYQDTKCGGFQNSTSTLTPNSLCENWTSAQIGMAFLLAGDINTARQTGEFLIKMWNLQEDIPNKFYFVYDSVNQVLLKKSDEPDITYLIKANEERQWFWGPGLVAAFLCHLFLYTSEQKYLDYAKKYQDFVQSCTEKQFNGIEVCKTGWGAAELYKLTKDISYKDWAIRVGDYFLNTQKEDGRWIDDRFNHSTVGQDIAITDQQALWLNYIIKSLV